MKTIKFVIVVLLGIVLGGCNPGEDKPSAPTGVTATAGNGQVTISWSEVKDTSTYNIYMATQSGVTKSNYAALAGGMKHASVTSPYVHTGLANGTAYYFVVTAVNSVGESVESSEVSATPQPAATGVSQFNGIYTGSWSGGQSNGASLTGTLTLTVADGLVTGDASPISGSTRTITGTMSATGAIAASIPMGSNGCDVSLAGQVSTNSSGGLTATGTYTLIASLTCNTNSGTWTATTTPLTPLNLTITHQGPSTGATGIKPLGYVCNSITPCVFSIPSGTVLNLSANAPSPTPGIFSNGTGSAAGCVTSTCSFTMTTDSAVTTTFDQSLGPFPALTITLAGTGTGVLSAGSNTCQNSNLSGCSTTWASGSVVTLQAEEPPVGTTFGGFSGACVSSTTTCTFTITNNSSVTATFN